MDQKTRQEKHEWRDPRRKRTKDHLAGRYARSAPFFLGKPLNARGRATTHASSRDAPHAAAWFLLLRPGSTARPLRRPMHGATSTRETPGRRRSTAASPRSTARWPGGRPGTRSAPRSREGDGRALSRQGAASPTAGRRTSASAFLAPPPLPSCASRGARISAGADRIAVATAPGPTPPSAPPSPTALTRATPSARSRSFRLGATPHGAAVEVAFIVTGMPSSRTRPSKTMPGARLSSATGRAVTPRGARLIIATTPPAVIAGPTTFVLSQGSAVVSGTCST